MGSTERDLVRRVLAGDERAFAEFFDGYFPALFRFALARLAGTRMRPRKSSRRLSPGRCGNSARIAGMRPCRLGYARSAGTRSPITGDGSDVTRRMVQLVEDDPDVAAALDALAAATEAGQEAAVRRDETTRLVHVVLDRLPPRYAAVLEWKYLDGMSVSEIAQRMEATSKATESTLTRAREAFREGIALLTRGRPGGEQA